MLLLFLTCVVAETYTVHFDSNTNPILEHTETKITLAIPSLCTLFGGTIQQPLFDDPCAPSGQWALLGNYMYFLPPNRETVCGVKVERIFRFSLMDWEWERFPQDYLHSHTKIEGIFAFESALLVLVQEKQRLRLHKWEQEKWTGLHRISSITNYVSISWESPNEICIDLTDRLLDRLADRLADRFVDGFVDTLADSNASCIFDFRNMTVTKMHSVRCKAKTYSTMWKRVDEVEDNMQKTVAMFQTTIDNVLRDIHAIHDILREKHEPFQLSTFSLFGFCYIWVLLVVEMSSMSKLFDNKS
jgi:hypothetical protein